MDSKDPLPCQEIISLKKLKAEGRLVETKTVLGWDLDTRQLLISLPMDKYERWSVDIQRLLTQKRVNTKQMEQMVGRLNHTAAIYY
jgi:hypothetical protein